MKFFKKNQKAKVSVNMRARIISYILHIIFFLLTFYFSIKYSIVQNPKLFYEGDYAGILGTGFGVFIVVYVLGIFGYRRGHGDFTGVFKKDILKIGRASISFLFALFILLMAYDGAFTSYQREAEVTSVQILGRITKDEFVEKVREKYPVYEDMSDDELYNKVLEKYPVYQNQIISE